MNIKEEHYEVSGINKLIELNEMLASIICGYSESLCSTDTYQFDNYSKYVADSYYGEEKAKRRKEGFPQDCEKAFEMGVRFVSRQKTLEGQK